MNSKKINEKIRNAFTDVTPDVLDSVLYDCNEQPEADIDQVERNSRKNFFPRIAVSIAAALIILVGVMFAGNLYVGEHKIDSVVSIEVNPGIEIKINSKDKVVNVLPLNEDGKKIIGDVDFTGKSLDYTVDSLIDSMVNFGYLSKENNSILLSVENSDPDKCAAIRSDLADKFDSYVMSDSFNVSVMSQTVDADPEVELLADRYGITISWAHLINSIVSENTFYEYDELVTLSVTQLYQLSEAGGMNLSNVQLTGSSNTNKYIGIEKAKSIAINDAITVESQIDNYKYKTIFYNEGVAYEISFVKKSFYSDYLLSYSCIIDAVSGEVLYRNDTAEEAFENNNLVPATALPEPSPTSFSFEQYKHQSINSNSNVSGSGMKPEPTICPTAKAPDGYEEHVVIPTPFLTPSPTTSWIDPSEWCGTDDLLSEENPVVTPSPEPVSSWCGTCATPYTSE